MKSVSVSVYILLALTIITVFTVCMKSRNPEAFSNEANINTYTNADNSTYVDIPGTGQLFVRTNNGEKIITEINPTSGVRFAGGATFDGGASFGEESMVSMLGDLSVAGSTQLKGQVTAEDSFQSKNNSFLNIMSVTGPAAFSNVATFYRPVNFLADSTFCNNSNNFTGNVGVTGAFNVTGASAFGGVSVTGPSAFGGNAEFASALGVQGASTFKSSMSVGGDFSTDGATAIKGLKVTGDAVFANPVVFQESVYADTDVNFQRNIVNFNSSNDAVFNMGLNQLKLKTTGQLSLPNCIESARGAGKLCFNADGTLQVAGALYAGALNAGALQVGNTKISKNSIKIGSYELIENEQGSLVMTKNNQIVQKFELPPPLPPTSGLKYL